MAKAPNDANLLSQQNDLTAKIEDTTTVLSEQASTLQGWIAQSTDANGVIPMDVRPDVDSWTSSLNDIYNIGKSESEVSKNNLDTYFSSLGGGIIKDYLENIVKSGGSANDALEEFTKTGMKLKDIKVSKEGFKEYFDNVAKSAKEASEAVNTVDGSVEGVAAAFKTENQDSQWNSMSSYLAQAKELYKNGKIGTDDFKSAAQFLSPTDIISDGNNPDAYVQAWNAAQEKLKRYFDSENPMNSANNFKDDLAAHGFGTKNGNTMNWTEKFKTSADAAKELGLSIEATEVLMHNLESYGTEFGDIMWSGESIKEYKSTLDEIQSLYDTMDEGSSKDRLKELLKGWNKEYELAEQDISNLTEEQVIKIKFEYEMAELQSEIDRLQSLVDQGDNSAQTYAALNAAKESYRDKRETETGYDEEDSEGYKRTSEKVDTLKSQLSSVTDKDKRTDIVQEISSLLDLQGAFQNAFSDGTVTNWEEFLNSAQAEEVFDAIEQKTGQTKEQLMEAYGEPQKIKFEGEVNNLNDIKNQLDSVPTGSTITYTAQVDGAAATISAIKNEDGTISYSANIGGAWQTVYPITNTDGTVTYTAETSKIDSVNNSTNGGTRSVEYQANTFGLPTSLPPITRTVNYTYSSTAEAATGGLHGFVYRTPFNGTAHASGDWSIKRNENALVGELGQETIVRGGKFFTVGDRGAEFASLRRGDIVFNHKQTEELFKNGHVTSGGGRAKVVMGSALASGTAYASGSKDSYLDSLTDYFDWIKIRMDKLSDATKRAIDSIDTAVGLASKQSQNTAALSQIQKEISENQSAYDRYLSHANWFAGQSGLSSSYQSQIQNGTLDISKLDDDTKKKVDEYKKWYDLAQDCLDTVNELREKETKLAQDRLEYIEKYYDKLIDASDAIKDLNEAKLDFADAMGYSQVSEEVQALIRDSMNEELKTYNHLSEQLAAYQAEFDALMSKGYIKKDSDAYYDGQKQIVEFNKAILKSSTALAEFGDQLRTVEYTKLEHVIDSLSRELKRLENIASLDKAKGKPVAEEQYQAQIDQNNASIEANYELRKKKLDEQNFYDVDSEKYQKLAKEISDLDSEIFNLMEDNEDLKESIWELRFTEPLENLMDGYDRTMKSADSLRKLMDDDTFLDENGALTENGLANLALLMQSYNTAKQKVADYQAAVRKLDEAYASGILSQKQYDESLNDLLKDIQSSVADVEDYKDEIIDLYKDQIKAEVDYMQEYIDKRQEMRKKEEDYYEFSKKMRTKNKDVNQLKAQIAALQGTNNASAQAELKRLNQELAEKQEELDETRRDHRNDMIDEGYDSLSDKLDDTLDKTLLEITNNAEKQEQVIADMLGKVYQNYETTYGKINQLIHNTGFMGDTGFNQNLSGLGTQAGAQSQVQAGTTSQPNTNASGTVTNVNTDSINPNPGNDQILEEISKAPNTENRLVAELTLTQSSVSLMEGKSANVGARIRPTDAANKTLQWTSSNERVATVSSGSIHAIKAGSASITCATTDGSGLTATVSVTVTAPPPPTPPAPKPNTSNNGNYGGIPFVYKYDSYPKNRLSVNTSIVDRLKSHNFDSSFGARGTLYSYWFGGGYMGSASQNTALINKMRSAGYRSGTRSVPATGNDWVHEGEIIIRPSDGGILFPLKHRDGVIPSGLSENLWKLAENAPRILGAGLLDTTTITPILAQQNQTTNTAFHFGTLLNIEGNADANTVEQLKDALPSLGQELTQIVSKELHKDWKKLR
ncbi:Ig-like domain-containing protein [Bariatricus massiliensis]|uniref:Ig-like domain-containing protein n=1 Tax=Bariatricus massiliensis TaxID=1745713 RepID=A0ABS8DN51_9FIRM|nr:Ig-like domain-containing protein [Bariatricus massiliensis]MCB7303130.1 Ig-like domain-containing protein [Bariatricus massiliensis]MCB7374346.1 Ig-like domain-containing protein [Bariatricus massiliensis]MCB7389567.1 Ig-like domain-containing protein [Bariatricus massiliensis]MCB7413724.1 Ig-like domain-containing protein [Bariatricus massiliensis]MCQ5252004.1 Ig-like domain-containing protein [Bariatricus massiliensis]